MQDVLALRQARARARARDQ